MALGVFDSGVGGLTVYRELAKAFPRTDLFYLGDTARVPYGNKSSDTIIRYAVECADYLAERYDIEGFIVACNTISSYAIDKLEERFGIPVLGVIQAGAEQALKVSRENRIGVIGTLATVRSGAYVNMLEKLSNNTANVWQKACPLFVPLVEEGVISGDIPKLTAKLYLDELVKNDIDTLILGCTHYPVLLTLIAELYPEITIVDSATVMVEQIRNMQLAREEGGKREISITDASPAFESLKTMLVGDIPMEIVTISGDGCQKQQ